MSDQCYLHLFSSSLSVCCIFLCPLVVYNFDKLIFNKNQCFHIIVKLICQGNENLALLDIVHRCLKGELRILICELDLSGKQHTRLPVYSSSKSASMALSIPAAGQKDRRLWGREWTQAKIIISYKYFKTYGITLGSSR